MNTSEVIGDVEPVTTMSTLSTMEDLTTAWFNCSSTTDTDVLDAFNCTSGDVMSATEGMLEIFMIVGTLAFIVFTSVGIGLFCASHKTRTPKQKGIDDNFNIEDDYHNDQTVIIHAHDNPSFTTIDERNHHHHPSPHNKHKEITKQKQHTSPNKPKRKVSYADEINNRYFTDSSSSSEIGSTPKSMTRHLHDDRHRVMDKNGQSSGNSSKTSIVNIEKDSHSSYKQNGMLSDDSPLSDNHSVSNGHTKGSSNIGYQDSDESGT